MMVANMHVVQINIPQMPVVSYLMHFNMIFLSCLQNNIYSHIYFLKTTEKTRVPQPEK